MSRTHADIVAELQSRWPEHKVGRSQARVRALCDLLGSPQDACPVILVTGTNGKGSTAAMIDSLLSALGLRVGRFSSPHLVDLTERITAFADFSYYKADSTMVRQRSWAAKSVRGRKTCPTATSLCMSGSWPVRRITS